ncbi:MAG: hypothetical protein A2Y24_06855 [Clostridiales bacterium GWE2_32_10]|nr:MAG: hypothetical protein A2Y24_06855 [Clostridiales bacterium GWE2_32_10]HBY19972.1 hypothetical protein [Clostridiales bacterium]
MKTVKVKLTSDLYYQGKRKKRGEIIEVSEDAICIYYESGYKTTDIVNESNKEIVLPISIKQAILLLVGHFYDNRETTTQLNQVELPISAKHLLRRYKVFRL